MINLGRVVLASCALMATTSYADVVRVQTRDAGNAAVAVDVCLYEPLSGSILHGVTDGANGRYEFTVPQDGKYTVVASGAGFVGVDDQPDSHSNAGPYQDLPQLVSGNELSGPICKPSLEITSFVVNNKQPGTYSNTVPIHFSTSVAFGKPIEYCLAETRQGIVGCRSGSAQWRRPDAQGPDAYSDFYRLRTYRDIDLTLMVRFQDQSQTSAPALASLYRSGLPLPAIMTGSFRINSGDVATDDPNVELSWAVISDPALRVEHCIRQVTPQSNSTTRCADESFQLISPSQVSNGIATYDSSTSLAGNSGMKNLALEIRYADYNDVRDGPARDGIILSDNLVAEFPCFASNLGEDIDISETANGSQFDYRIPAEEASAFALRNGFGFSSSSSSSNGICTVGRVSDEENFLPSHGILLFTSVTPNPYAYPFAPLTGTYSGSCNHRMFEDRTLNSGWTYQGQSFEENIGVDLNDNGVIEEDELLVYPGCTSSLTEPAIGGSSLSTTVRIGWPESSIGAYYNCHRVVTEISLRGPACANWRDAFLEPETP